MRGRNDNYKGKRLAFSACLMLVALSIIGIFYGSFLKAAIQSKSDSTHVQDVGEMASRRLGKNMAEDDDGNEAGSETDEVAGHSDSDVTVKSFPSCDLRHSEIIPCLDRHLNSQLKLKLNLSLMEHYERHCPPPHRRLNCLIPPPPNYKVPIQWPASRDEVWQSNVPHTFLAMEKSDQHWMTIKGEKVNFPGGGTHFHDGADKYIASLAKMLRYDDENLSNHGNIRTVLDVGCGVASFGAYLLPLDILAMSVAPNDVHENQIQFALERGIPSTLGILGTKRLPFPSKSFDLAHCSRCRIDWLQRDGILLLEVDRLLRPGGFFAWSSPPAYRDDEEDVQIWNGMSDLVERMCWKVASKEGQTVIWKKAETADCYNKRPEGVAPPLCDEDDDPDSAWDAPMKACISRFSQGKGETRKKQLVAWPSRLTSPPLRLKDLGVSNQHFQKDDIVWQSRVDLYWKQMDSEIEEHTFRNIMDMRAHFGSFAAALVSKPVWVMNVVPTPGHNTLPLIYDRGLIGSLHNWCESFSTYPRTYDLLHAWNVFSDIENQGCSSMEDLLLEMDRILRPKGFVIIRDKGLVIDQIRTYLSALHWDAWSTVVSAESDELSTEDDKILFARKQLFIPDDDA
ncbi:hypothetical protein KP509_03G077500 [Ceratopteris richardii]|nr:hypothetical protein KP509_03G077500 [Ceratopteris richardii]KAH7442224.1 hypothetical protein KP509_03G077500 [Ceratopteris richardii]KAH7442225.1 hypothetical protein KP509_03G077500 [Ceratopteris richardii]KAH7442226.1 hypothetical protein KP509_03G077500 [Ceratopteris richardii]KAH7442227.1 hypothetical protein KP509_03G077500 [Ceratopteris richardii]